MSLVSIPLVIYTKQWSFGKERGLNNAGLSMSPIAG